MAFEQQKEAAGGWATFTWIGSGLYLYLSTEGVSLLSWSALGFFVVGSFAAAIVFGVAIYGLQWSIAKILAKVIRAPGRNIASAVQGMGCALLVAEAVLIFFAASWVFHQIEPTHPSVPAEYRADRANFITAMNAFFEANELNQKFMAGRDVVKGHPEQEVKEEALIEKGLEYGRKVRPEFLSYLDPDLPTQYRTRLIQGHEFLLQGRKNGNVLTQGTGIELIRRFYEEFWPAHVDAIITKLDGTIE